MAIEIGELQNSELPALRALLQTAGADLGDRNIQQFVLPRRVHEKLAIYVLVARSGGTILGTLGVFEVPLKLRGQTYRARWPINFFMLPELKGQGIGTRLVERMWDGADWSIVIGSTPAAQRVFDKMGYRRAGHLTSFRWLRLLPSILRVDDRLRPDGRRRPPSERTLSSPSGEIHAVAADRAPESTPWVDRQSGDRAAVVRDSAYLDFAYFGPLEPEHVLYVVSVGGERAGFFVLSPHRERRLFLTVDIVDIGSGEGREVEVLRAALAVAGCCGQVVRLRVCGDRFVAAARSLGPSREDEDAPVRVWTKYSDVADSVADAGRWHLTFGDDDQFRVRASSQRWL